MAIGDHLLLGGDNLDLALATIVERRIAEVRPTMRLTITQRSSLRRLCSAAKERMLGEATADRVPITVLGAGRSLIGDSITLDLTRVEVEAALNEFLPLTRADEESRGRDRRAGLRELGLPCETDPRSRAIWPPFSRAPRPSSRPITAPWLTAGRRMIRPDLVLFNGGFFTPPVARERIAQALAGWFGNTPRLLVTGNLEAAVAIGAATYARLRAGIGRTESLVKAGSGRAYCRSRRSARSGMTAAVCVLARGTEEGTERTFDHLFTVVTNRPVSFSLFSSTTRGSPAISSLSIRTWTRGNMRRSSPYSASGGSRVTSSCRSDCRSRSRKSARWTYGADRRRLNIAGGCSFRCGALRRRWTERRARRRRMSRAKS